MKTLKEKFLKTKKEEVYAFYTKIIKEPDSFSTISRNDMYEAIINEYQENPEMILELCSMEELHILKSLLDNPITNKSNGYIEYLLFTNLKKNYLVLEDDNYYIPSDLINYIKMAFNLLDEKSFSLKDVTDSVLIGLIRIYNVLTLDDFIIYLENYYICINKKDLKEILKSPKFIDIMKITKYKKVEYVVSLEKNFYKDVITLSKEYIKPQIYLLEEVISIGKYKINLFKEEILNFLSFLEMHLESFDINSVIEDVILYMGFDIEDENALNKISGEIPALLEEIKKILVYMPIWVYKGNNLISLKKNIILPKKNELCFCGSGKKFKHCCRKYYKK